MTGEKGYDSDGSRGAVVTVGTFDGVHRGHREVLRCVTGEAARLGLRPVVVTFDRHPLEVVAPERAPGLIMDADRRDALLREAGVEVHRVEFSEETRRKTAGEWMRELAKQVDPQQDQPGEGLRIGNHLPSKYTGKGVGTDDAHRQSRNSRRTGESLGIEVRVAPAIEGCSSSAVRHAVKDGDMERAAWILGRPFSLTGTVVKGRQLGRTIGVPTANVAVPSRQLPAGGVYAAEVTTPDGGKHRAVVNVGKCPTVTDAGTVTVEAHILDYNADLYGRQLTVSFLRRLRDERKFDTLTALREQIARDIAEASKSE